jgi:hypothetical protein
MRSLARSNKSGILGVIPLYLFPSQADRSRATFRDGLTCGFVSLAAIESPASGHSETSISVDGEEQR